MRMSLVDSRGLGRTLDGIERRLEQGAEPSSSEEALEVVGWLLARQRRRGRDAGIFEPLPADFGETRLATGERLKTRLAVRNVLSHRAVRALKGFADGDRRIEDAVEHALEVFRDDCYAKDHCAIGECAHSAISYMRLVACLDVPSSEAWIEAQMAILREQRLKPGRWKGFPFHYTLLALLELPEEMANDELRHAVPACLRVRSRVDPPQFAGARRSDVVERVLARMLDAAPLRLPLGTRVETAA